MIAVKKTIFAAAVAILASALVAGCGDDKNDTDTNAEAIAAVCSAADDLAKQFKEIESLTLSNISRAKINSIKDAVTKDFQAIDDHRDAIKQDRQEAITAAIDEFKTAINDSNASLPQLLVQLNAAAGQLGNNLKTAATELNCPA